MFSISSFKSNYPIVRPNLFYAEVTLPPTLAPATTTTAFNRPFRFRCQATEFPGRTIATKDDISFGPTTKFGYDVTYNDISLQIIASEDMIERNIFELWMDSIVTKSGTTGGNATGGFVKYFFVVFIESSLVCWALVATFSAVCLAFHFTLPVSLICFSASNRAATAASKELNAPKL